MDELGLMHAFGKHCSLCLETLVHIPFILITFFFFIPALHRPAAAPSEFRDQGLPLAQVWPACCYAKAEGRSQPGFKESCSEGRWENPPDGEPNIRGGEKGTIPDVEADVITGGHLCPSHTSLHSQ